MLFWMRMHKRWRVAETVSQKLRARFPEFPPLFLQLLVNRGLTTQQQVDEFLNPDYGQDVGDPFLFLDMRRAVDRITKALERGERITVYGDYDADGICGAAVLSETLEALGGIVDVYLPYRQTEGYGLNNGALDTIAKGKTTLLISVDCGITSVGEVAYAKQLGIEVIIVDHHHEPPALPDAYAILNPVVQGETYPFKGFCGTGVAFKVVQALLIATADGTQLQKPHPVAHGWEKWLLDLVAIATVADFSDLIGENRTLVSYGLLVLRKTRRKGLRRLFDVAGINSATLTTSSIGYQIAPRINAAGRMNHASAALYLLKTRDEAKAQQIAVELQETNRERQRVTEQITTAALAQIGKESNERILCVIGEGWQAGVIGIVAGRVLNQLHKPVIIMGQDGDKIVGSGRSIKAYNIIEALERARAHLDRFGGHPQACGFTIMGRDKAERFMAQLRADAREKIAEADLIGDLAVDAEVQLRDLHWELIDLQAKLEPYGEENPRPVFAVRGLRIIDASPVGSAGNHLRVFAEDERGARALFIGFGYGADVKELAAGRRIDIAFELGVNEWNGNRELQRKIVDWQPHGTA